MLDFSTWEVAQLTFLWKAMQTLVVPSIARSRSKREEIVSGEANKK
jgi:hypothetical protein